MRPICCSCCPDAAMSRRCASMVASIWEALTMRASKETVATLLRKSNATSWMPGSFFTARAILTPHPLQKASGAARDRVWGSGSMAMLPSMSRCCGSVAR